ncbi:HAMP domain-containing sensor histidine kinase [Komagataeibacter sp. FNDCF1]|uniref:sensor histidine kinase n=1 Tax=Komagataeibacter sp. FNDCF1 TaxID=2878681 RepID=UPI001E384796|nr:HAMP domain-containing sensor histidine kinase [Komagataeibacter sp. FNDCF1]MCE2564873.1 HAMP domain-containing histidine kinase [Komagataeibacter sp. FNDCF1]
MTAQAFAPAPPPRRSRWRAWRSASLRFSLAYGLMFALSSILFMSFLWWGTIGFLERQVETAINADARALAERWVMGGLPTLALTIEDRLEQNLDDDAIYLVIDPQGNYLTGNVSAWPGRVQYTDRWYSLPDTRAGLRSMAELHAYNLPGTAQTHTAGQLDSGYRLLVGRDVRARGILRHLLTDSLLWAWVMVTLLAVSGAVLVHRIFRRMVKTVARTTSAIAHGDLSRRMPLVGNGDEMDQVAEAINEMLDRIVRLMDGVRQVSNAIAHDLRTPIARARTQLEDAALHATTPEELRGAIERAVGNLDNVTAVFEALLRIAQIEAGARRSAFMAFDMVPVLLDVADLYEAVAEEHAITLDLDLPDRLPFYGDRSLIQQAVANMLDNAIKFSPSGGTVHLRAQIRELAPGRITGPTGEGMLDLSVSDEGIGMSEADMARATERFFRAEKARNTPGAGLGLSMVRAIVQLHGGRMHLSAHDPGLTVSMALPIAACALSDDGRDCPSPQGISGMTRTSPFSHQHDMNSSVK